MRIYFEGGSSGTPFQSWNSDGQNASPVPHTPWSATNLQRYIGPSDHKVELRGQGPDDPTRTSRTNAPEGCREASKSQRQHEIQLNSP